jgi:hypothetical protein
MYCALPRHDMDPFGIIGAVMSQIEGLRVMPTSRTCEQ